MIDKPQTHTERRAAKVQHTHNRIVFRPELRLYLYRVLAALGPLVAFYGVMSNEEVALWLGVGGVILATPIAALAASNVPRE